MSHFLVLEYRYRMSENQSQLGWVPSESSLETSHTQTAIDQIFDHRHCHHGSIFVRSRNSNSHRSQHNITSAKRNTSEYTVKKNAE